MPAVPYIYVFKIVFLKGDSWCFVLNKFLTFNPLLFTSTAELSKHKRYEIRMSVYNAVGEGPTSTPQEVFVGEAGMYASCHFNQHRLLHKVI